MKFKRINVIGTSGSGKSTFSKQLASALNAPYLEMDAIYWKPNWVEPDDVQYFSDLKSALDCDAWVLDGNYSRTAAIKWKSVDTIIWLDYGFIRTFWQVIKRSITRAISRKEIWKGTGNKESFRRSFCSKKSVILWMLQNYHSNKRKYLALMSSEKLNDIQFYRIRSLKEAEYFLQNINGH